MQNSILLAYEELGLQEKDVELIFEDWEGNWPKLASATQKLIQVDKVDAIINSFDKASYIVAPLAKKAQIPHLVLALDDRIADGKYNFTVWTPVEATSQLLLQKAYLDGHRKLALFILRDYYPYRSQIEIQKQLKDFPDMEISFIQQYDPSVRDFRTMSLKAYANDWDLGILLGYPPSADIFYKQLLSEGSRPITSDAAFDMFSDHSIIPDRSWWVGAAENTPAFEKAYIERFGQKPFTGVTYSYDCLKLIIAAWKESPNNLSEALHMVKVQGAGGETYFNEKGVAQMDGYFKWILDDKIHKATNVPATLK